MILARESVKGHWQQKIGSSYIKVFHLNNQNIAV